MLWWIVAPDAISAHDVSVKILHRFRPEHSCPHHNIFKKRRAVCRLAFGFSGTPCFLVLHAPREGCRELSLVICFFLPVNTYVKTENVQRGVQKAHSHSPLFWKKCFEWPPPWQSLSSLPTSHLEVCMAYIFRHFPLAFYLTFYSDFLFWHYLSGIYSNILSGIYSDTSSGILSGIISGTLPGIYSSILSGAFSGILFGILTWHSILAFYLASNLTFYSAILSIWHSGIYFGILSGIPSDILSWNSHRDLALAVEVRQCPLRSGAHGWSPALPTEIWSFTVETRQCPLRSGARSWGPAAPTEIWSLQLRPGRAHWDLELALAEEGGGRREVTRTKSRDPHGSGEKKQR